MTTVETRYDLGDVAYGVRTQTAQPVLRGDVDWEPFS